MCLSSHKLEPIGKRQVNIISTDAYLNIATGLLEEGLMRKLKFIECRMVAIWILPCIVV